MVDSKKLQTQKTRKASQMWDGVAGGLASQE